MTENPYRHPDITAARQQVKSAEEALAETIARVQADCEHDRVAESESGVRSNEMSRICLVCGLEATERWGNFAPDHPLGTEFVARVNRDRFYGYRP